jgi:hypothetical protein
MFMIYIIFIANCIRTEVIRFLIAYELKNVKISNK